MKRMLHRRPSASMIVALAALVLAASGTAVAASKLTSGDNLIKKNSLSGNRLRNHTLTGTQIKNHALTGTQINLKKLGTVPSATNATHATSATSATSAAVATSATNATNATNAANLAGVTRFRTTIASAGSSFATGANVTLATAGPFTLFGNCYSSGGATTGGFYLSTTVAAHYDAYDRSFSGSPLIPGTPEDVDEDDAVATPPAIDLEDPADGTFSAITDTGSSYITGLASVAVNLNSATGCTFAGFTSAS